jgi:hypothetical protein
LEVISQTVSSFDVDKLQKVVKDNAEEGKKLINVYQSKVDEAQDLLCKISVFVLPKELRRDMLEKRAEIQKQLDVYHSVLADMKRGVFNISTVAKANDIRFTGEITARHKRTLDRRAQRNAAKFSNMQERVSIRSIGDLLDILLQYCSRRYQSLTCFFRLKS